MRIIPLVPDKPYFANSYLIISGDRFLVIDPTVSYQELRQRVPQICNMTAECVLLTHAHIDHFSEVDSYASEGITLFVSEDDAKKLTSPTANAAFLFPDEKRGYFGEYSILKYGSYINIGDEKLLVLHTPGHTSGSVSFLADKALFSGDTVFARGYGRYDLASGNRDDLFLSISTLISLVSDTVVYPGHGPICDIEQIKSYLQ